MLLAMIALLAVAVAGALPDRPAGKTVLFASPNTMEPLGDAQARARLKSFEQINADAVADRAACALGQNVQVADALGIYDQSSENSLVLTVNLTRRQSEYLAAILGAYSRQESVLLFFDQPGGGDQLWVVRTPQPLDGVIATLRKLKLTPVTVRPGKEQNEIWLVDFGKKREEDLNVFVSKVNGRPSLTTGIAELLGKQDRDAAVRNWRRQIRAFEQHRGPRLSGELSSTAWRNATVVHTCSTEMPLL